MPLLPILLVALAHLPLLTVYFEQLWSRPHYQFFPLVLGTVAYFLWQRWHWRGAVSAGAQLLSRVLLLVSVPILAYAFVRLSPMFAYVSFVLVVGSLLLRLGIPALGPWLLLWLLVRIPYGQDVALIQWMQRLTTQLSSTALERIGIEHIADGNVLLFPTTSLFVEEACSGVVSLLAIVACAGILAVWWHRSVVHSLLLTGTAIFLAGAMNIVRVVTIAVALDSFDVNLTEGWRHDGLGLVIFAISLLALFSVDRLLGFFLSPIERNPLAGYWDDAEGNVLVDFWNRFIGLEDVGDNTLAEDELNEHEPETRAPDSLVVKGGRVLGATWDWAIAAVFVMLGAGQVYAGIGPFSVAPEVSPMALKLSEESLPESWGAWNQVGFEDLERDSSSAFGEHSRIWAYHNGTTTVRVSLDFVFPEWHALSACYSGVGWIPETDQKHAPPDGQPCVEATFSKPNGDWAMLMYDLFDDEGRPYEAPSGTFVHPTLRRILGGQSSRWNLPNYYQIQALAVSNAGPLPESERRSVRELFQWFRQNLNERFVADSSSNVSVDRETSSPDTRSAPGPAPLPKGAESLDTAPNARQLQDERAAVGVTPNNNALR